MDESLFALNYETSNKTDTQILIYDESNFIDNNEAQSNESSQVKIMLHNILQKYSNVLILTEEIIYEKLNRYISYILDVSKRNCY